MTAVDGSGGSGDADARVSVDANPAAALFFVIAQLVLNAFLLELFTGSIIDTYTRLRDEQHGSVLLSDSQVRGDAFAVSDSVGTSEGIPSRFLLRLSYHSLAERMGSVCADVDVAGALNSHSPYSTRPVWEALKG